MTDRCPDSPTSIFTTLRQCVTMLPAAMRWRWAVLIPLSLITGIVEAGAAAAVFALIKIIGDPAQITRVPVAARIASALPGSTARTQLLIFTSLIGVYYLVKNPAQNVMEVLNTLRQQRSPVKSDGDAQNQPLSAIGLPCGCLSVPPWPQLGGSHFEHKFLRRHGMQSCDGSRRRGRLRTAYCNCHYDCPADEGAGSNSGGRQLLGGLARRRAPTHPTNSGTFQHPAPYNLNGFRACKPCRRRSARSRKSKLWAARIFSIAASVKNSVGCSNSWVTLARRLVDDPARREITETIFVCVCGALAVVALVTGTGQAGAQGPPLLALFAYAAFRIVPAANRIGWRVNQIRSAAPSVESLYDDYLLVAGKDWEQAAGERESAHFRECITFDRVSYTFAQADQPGLQDINLAIRFGESIGIVGPTGAGKTTLVDLVIGLLRPSSGRILIDGHDLSGRLTAWKRNIGYVPQTIFLIDDSLRRNIALGIGDNAIDESQVQAAVRTAQLERFVSELPLGLDSAVGERGIRLSGGERQRIGIARALYHDPDLLIFDEATSALDLATEDAVTEAIKALHGKKTLLVVAHRLSSVRRCDRLVFISEGRIRACCSYDDLLRDYPEFLRTMRVVDRIDPASA